MSFTDEQQRMLTAPLDLKHVVKPSGSFGPKGDYLEGWHVINELNRVFGFGGWSYTINLSRDALAEGKNGKGDDQWQAAYTCVCTLTVETETSNVVRQAVGFGSGFAKQVGDAIEGATKEAETDALKRAARTFGNIFGLALYDKSRANVQAAPPAKLSQEQTDKLMAELQARKIAPAALLKAAKNNLGSDVGRVADLPASAFADALSWIQSHKEAA